MANPFHYGTPVSGEQFAGREAETAALVDRISDGINVVVISPRRYGKTSLISQARRKVDERGGAVVDLNVLRCRDVGAFAAILATRAYQLRSGRWHRMRQAVPAFLRRLRVNPSVTFDGDHPRFEFAASLSMADADSVIEDVYALLGETPARAPAALILDEFQAITDLGRHLPALLKSLADAHPRVSLVMSGSKRHLMEQLVRAADAPLYGMAEHLALDVIPDDVMHGYVMDRAAAGRKPMSDAAASRLLELAGPIPNDIQHLAYEVFATADRQITDSDVERGLAIAVQHEATLHADRFESMSAGQRRVLARLAAEPSTEPYGAEFVRSVGLANASSVRNALDALVDREVVIARAHAYTVADPFFAAWLREVN